VTLTTPLKEALAVEEAFGKVPVRDIFRNWNGFIMEVGRGNWNKAYFKLIEMEGYSKIMAIDSKKNFEKAEKIFEELKTWVSMEAPYYYKVVNCIEIAKELLNEMADIGLPVIPVV